MKRTSDNKLTHPKIDTWDSLDSWEHELQTEMISLKTNSRQTRDKEWKDKMNVVSKPDKLLTSFTEQETKESRLRVTCQTWLFDLKWDTENRN